MAEPLSLADALDQGLLKRSGRGYLYVSWIRCTAPCRLPENIGRPGCECDAVNQVLQWCWARESLDG